MNFIGSRFGKRILIAFAAALLIAGGAYFLTPRIMVAGTVELPLWVTIGFERVESGGESSFGSRYSIDVYEIPAYAVDYITAHAGGGWRGHPMSMEERAVYFAYSNFARGRGAYFYMEQYNPNLAAEAADWFYRDTRNDRYDITEDLHQNLTGQVIAFALPVEGMLVVFHEAL